MGNNCSKDDIQQEDNVKEERPGIDENLAEDATSGDADAAIGGADQVAGGTDAVVGGAEDEAAAVANDEDVGPMARDENLGPMARDEDVGPMAADNDEDEGIVMDDEGAVGGGAEQLHGIFGGQVPVEGEMGEDELNLVVHHVQEIVFDALRSVALGNYNDQDLWAAIDSLRIDTSVFLRMVNDIMVTMFPGFQMDVSAVTVLQVNAEAFINDFLEVYGPEIEAAIFEQFNQQ